MAVLLSTWWVPGFRITLVAGVPWLALITLCYWVWSRANGNKSAADGSEGVTTIAPIPPERYRGPE